jgi:hypothetical protein
MFCTAEKELTTIYVGEKGNSSFKVRVRYNKYKEGQ